MNEHEFAQLADAELDLLEAALEATLDASGADFDLETKPGGILELECADGSKVIINRHTAAREIWVAARAGGYHFAYADGQWLSGRDGSELWAVLARCVQDQTGESILLKRSG